MRWSEWRGSLDGRPALLIRVLGAAFGCKVQLHKFIRADDPGCFHTHPATAIRIILWGGYVEELGDGSLRTWRPGMVGIVRPELEHRIASLRNGKCSWSIWLRGRKRAAISMRGYS